MKIDVASPVLYVGGRTYSTYCHKAAKLQKARWYRDQTHDALARHAQAMQEADVKQLVDNPAVFETTKACSIRRQLLLHQSVSHAPERSSATCTSLCATR